MHQLTTTEDKWGGGQNSTIQEGFVSSSHLSLSAPISDWQRADNDDIPMITRFNTHTNRGDWQPPVPTLEKEGFTNRV